MFGTRLFLLLSLCGALYATTTTNPSTTVPPSTATLVVSTGESGVTGENLVPLEEAGPPKPRKKPYSYSLKVNSTILSRYSTTVVKSRTVNPEDIAQEATFLVTLPDSAFISNFSMIIKEIEYVAYVKEKEEAKKIYDQAVSQGQTAAHVEARDSNNFAVSVNIGPNEKIDFKLTYEELLQRRRGSYEQQINISPGQVVEELSIDVYILENNNISFINVPDIRNDVEIKLDEKENALATINYLSGNQAHIAYHPTKRQQLDASESGIFGQFVVEYDVQRGGDGDAGELQVVDGYFVHFFAPETINPIKKHVVFVIDTSGSMSGRKIVQTREALNSILSDLRPDDLFSLLEFNSEVRVWNGEKAVDTSYTEPFHFNPPPPPFPPGLPSPPAPPRPFPPFLPGPSYLPSPPSPPISTFSNTASSSGSSPLPPSPASPPGLPPGLSPLPLSSGNRPPAIAPALFPPSSSPSSSSTGSPSLPTGPSSSPVSGTSSASTSLPTSKSGSSTSSSTSQGASVSSTTTPKTESTTEYYVPRNPIAATPENIRMAKDFVDTLVASGGTNINDALLEAMKHTEESANRVDMVPLIVFLTDGEPTVGESSPDAIIKNIKQGNAEQDVPIFTLAFGSGADFEFLKKLSLQNSGFVRRIYEASDASLQLQEFFEEILTPLLSNIKITYLEDNVENGTVSKSVFRSYFKGSELVVTGRLSSPNFTDFKLEVEGISSGGPYLVTCFPHRPGFIPPPVDPEPRADQGPYSNFLERLWAYRTIRDLLDQLVKTDNETEKEEIKKEALDIALQYNFVTDVTSLVVVKPNSTEEGKVTDSNSPSAESVAGFGGVGLLSSHRSFGPRGQSSRRRMYHRNGVSNAMLSSSSRHYPAAIMPPPPPAPPRHLGIFTRGQQAPRTYHVHQAPPMPPGPPGLSFDYFGLSGPMPLGGPSSSATTVTTPPALSWDNVTVHDNGTAIFPNGTEIELGLEEPALTTWDDCTTTANETGTCRYIQYCARPEYTTSFENFMEESCMVVSEFGDLFFGVCCPEDMSTTATTMLPTTANNANNANNASFIP